MKDIKISKSRNKKEKTVNVLIENECTINNVEILYKELKDIFESFETFNISVKNIVNIDLAGYQLLYALKKELLAANKNVRFEFEINNELNSIMNNSGLKNLNNIN